VIQRLSPAAVAMRPSRLVASLRVTLDRDGEVVIAITVEVAARKGKSGPSSDIESNKRAA
jgi:hypothetical protein